MTPEHARKILLDADVFYYGDIEAETASVNAYEGEFWTPENKKELLDDIRNSQNELNMNDTWGWACAMGQKIEDSEFVEVGELYEQYGYCGILYWVSEKNNHMRSEFEDINRMVDFVRHEEQVRKAYPDSTERAYKKIVYELGKEPLDINPVTTELEKIDSHGRRVP